MSEALASSVEAAQRWAMHDPDHRTRGQLDGLIDQASPTLVELFDGRLGFGTAGLRAEVGPGPNRMNALVVRQTTVGVVRWLIESAGVEAPTVLIGFDARVDSADFAAHAAAAVLACGGTALLGDAAGPTPVFAHAMLGEGADAAVVITASHNPPADNGYKLYAGDGIQIVGPTDDEIAAFIEQAAAQWSSVAMDIDDSFAEIRSDRAGVQRSTKAWSQAHRNAALDALPTTTGHGRAKLRIAYTPLHGVGGAPFLAALQAAGFATPFVVADQFEPDGTFPTVPFPNPEEHGALDAALRLAVDRDAHVVIAHDPDADRLAIAVPARDGAGFTQLSGNELGVLLADHLLNSTEGDRVVARSVVSTRLLDAIAAAHGVTCVVTLTGFKWVARPILTHAPAQYVLGFEEAIGYCVGSLVRDKDGLGAGLVVADIIAQALDGAEGVWDRLDRLALTHGVYETEQVTLRFDDRGDIGAVMAAVEASPPDSLGGAAVTAVGPLGFGELPPTTGLHLRLADDSQVIIRPSGTEPKIKCYLEVIEPVAELEASRRAAHARLAALAADVRQLLAGAAGN